MRSHVCQTQWTTSPWTWTSKNLFRLIMTTLTLTSYLWKPTHSATECTKKKYYVNIIGMPLNATVTCRMYFQWTVGDYCCYSKYDRFDNDPYCCYSDTYKLVMAVVLICLVLMGSSSAIFFCWAYGIPHNVLRVLTCGKFNLNEWMKRNIINGPYVDPSFYSGEPFWSRGASGLQPYPLRPMPPRIFYPTAPANIKFGWDGLTHGGQIPLFVVASRQFTRNPYSARPFDRNLPSLLHNVDSRRPSDAIIGGDQSNNNLVNIFDFHLNIDEMDAATELLESLKTIEERSEKQFQIPNPTVIPDNSLTTDHSVVTDECVVPNNHFDVNENDKMVLAFMDHDDTAMLNDPENEDFSVERTTHPTVGSVNDDDIICGPSLIKSMIETMRVKTENYLTTQEGDLNFDAPIAETVSERESLVLQSDHLTYFTTTTVTKCPPSAISLGMGTVPTEVNRVDTPYTATKLPGTIPENSAE